MYLPTVHRLFHDGPLAAGEPLRLDPEASHHALRVLRLGPGDPVELFNGDGRRFPGQLLDSDARGASVLLAAPIDAGTESPLAIGLAQALPAGDKMDWVVEKAVELGVVAIQPLFSQKSLLRLDGARAERRLAHWRRVAVAACMQCGRDRLPLIAGPLPLSRWLADGTPPLAGSAPDHRLLLSPRADATLAGLARPLGSAWLLAGPEGGFSADEDAGIRAAGWQGLRLGPRILRTETAGLAAVAALQARFGDL
jgi:16S rRNA (uracil1498-N3)-methyltransferase